MADTPDTPPPGAETSVVTPRRRGPRKEGAPKAPATRRTKAAPKAVVEQAETAVKDVATRVKRGAAKAETAVVEAAKSVKPRAVGRPKTRATSKSAGKAPAKAKGKTGKWGVAAIAGGLVAAGAATAALLSIKGSSGKAPAPAKPDEGAHQPDGSDASPSFSAGIADESTIPN